MKRSFATLNCSSSSDNSNESILMDALKRIMMLFYGRFTTTTKNKVGIGEKGKIGKKELGSLWENMREKGGRGWGIHLGNLGKGKQARFPFPF